MHAQRARARAQDRREGARITRLTTAAPRVKDPYEDPPRTARQFGVVGVIATVIDFGVMNLLHYGLHLDILIANTVGFIISLVFNYAASMKFVFEHRDGMSRTREFTIFLILSVIGLLLNDGIVLILNKGGALEANIAKIAATALVMIYNFVTRKIFLDGTGA